MANPKKVSRPASIDLDAARAERTAKLEDPPTVTIGGRTIPLPHELPVAFLELVNADRFEEAIGELIEDPEDLNHFLSSRLSVPDLEVFADGIAESYGLPGGLGNLPASGAYSSRTSRR